MRRGKGFRERFFYGWMPRPREIRPWMNVNSRQIKNSTKLETLQLETEDGAHLSLFI